jgi:hypothetical protein
MLFNTWSVLNSLLCPGGGGMWFQMTKALRTSQLINKKTGEIGQGSIQ